MMQRNKTHFEHSWLSDILNIEHTHTFIKYILMNITKSSSFV